MNRLTQWLADRREPLPIRERRRYLRRLRQQQPFAAIRSSGVPEIRATHIACGLKHLPFEYCPARPGDPSGGEWS